MFYANTWLYTMDLFLKCVWYEGPILRFFWKNALEISVVQSCKAGFREFSLKEEKSLKLLKIEFAFHALNTALHLNST